MILDKVGPTAEKANDPHTWYILGNGYLKIKAAGCGGNVYEGFGILSPLWRLLDEFGDALELAGDIRDAMTAYNHGLWAMSSGHNGDHLKREIAQAAVDAARL